MSSISWRATRRKGRLCARRVLDVGKRPVGHEPLTHGAPKGGVQLRMAHPYPRECQASWSLSAAGRWRRARSRRRWRIEHRVHEPVRLRSRRHRAACPRDSRPASSPAARSCSHTRPSPRCAPSTTSGRRSPARCARARAAGGRTRSLETERDVKVARDELVHATIVDRWLGRTGKTIITCAVFGNVARGGQ